MPLLISPFPNSPPLGCSEGCPTLPSPFSLVSRYQRVHQSEGQNGHSRSNAAACIYATVLCQDTPLFSIKIHHCSLSRYATVLYQDTPLFSVKIRHCSLSRYATVLCQDTPLFSVKIRHCSLSRYAAVVYQNTPVFAGN